MRSQEIGNIMKLDEYLSSELNSMSPLYVYALGALVDELHHRTQLEQFSPDNPFRTVEFIKSVANDWGITDLWEVQAIGIEFNIQAEIDNDPEFFGV